jgi:hypothetical protein
MIGLVLIIAAVGVILVPFAFVAATLLDRDPRRNERRTARRLARRHGAFE